MKIAFLALILSTLLLACDRVTDLQVTAPPPLGVPASVTSALRTVFPQVQSVQFLPSEKNKLWTAAFRTDAAYAVAIDSSGAFYGIYRTISSAGLPPAVGRLLPAGDTSRLKVFQVLTEQRQVSGLLVVADSARQLTSVYQFDPAGRLRFKMSNRAYTPVPASFVVPLVNYFLTEQELPPVVRNQIATADTSSRLVFSMGTAAAGERTVYVCLSRAGRPVERFFDESGKEIAYGTVGLLNPPSASFALDSTALPAVLRDSLTLRYPGWRYRTGAVDGRGVSCLLIQAGSRAYRLLTKEGRLLSTQPL